MSGEVIAQGGIAAEAQAATAAMSGAMQPEGSLAAQLSAAMFSGEGVGLHPVGSIAATAQRASASMAGDQRSAIQVLLQRASATMSGAHTQTGTVTASVRRATASFGGELPEIPLSIVGYDAVDANSITLPAHSVGDLIVMFAYSDIVAVPSAPSAGGTVPSFSSLDSGSGNGNGSLTAYTVATATNHTSGTWTNTSSLCVVVLHGQNRFTPIGGHDSNGGSVAVAPSTATYTSPSITQSVTDGSSVLLYFYGGENTASWNAPPAGYTRLDSSLDVCVNTKDDTTSDGAAAQTAPLAVGAGNFRTAVVEVLN